jgi:hypothetical protein
VAVTKLTFATYGIGSALSIPNRGTYKYFQSQFLHSGACDGAAGQGFLIRRDHWNPWPIMMADDLDIA